MSFHLPHLSFLLQNGETRCLFHQEKIKIENKCDKTLEFWHITTQMLGQVGAGWRLRRSQSSNCRIQELLSCNSIIILKSLQKSFLKKKKKNCFRVWKKKFYLKVKGKSWHQNHFRDSLKSNRWTYEYSILLPLAQEVDDVQSGSFLCSQGEVLQTKETGRGALHLNHIQISNTHKTLPPSQSLVLKEIRTRNWEKKLEPGRAHPWHSRCDGSGPHDVPHSRKETIHCNVNSTPGLSYSKHQFIQIQEDYRLEKRTQRRNTGLGEKHGLSFVFWKHQEGTMEWVGEKECYGQEHLLPSHHTHLLSLITPSQLESFICGSMIQIKKQYKRQHREGP